MPIPLEDSFSDVIGKAQRGLNFPDEKLAADAKISIADLHALQQGTVNEKALRAVAGPLRLHAHALLGLAQKKYAPQGETAVEGLRQFSTNYGDMLVNSYLVWDPAEKLGAAFDTGADCYEMGRAIDDLGLRISYIFLTHTHVDHIADLTKLKKETGAKIAVAKEEAVGLAEAFVEGQRYTIGALSIETRLTSGHSRGGTTFVIAGLAKPVAVVGDSLFAGSMGGAPNAWNEALENNRTKILTLPDDTILCPGHGPLTTVADEKRGNPFFAA